MQYRLKTFLTLVVFALALLTAAGAYAEKGGKGGKKAGKGGNDNGVKAGQMINVRGTLTDEGVECQALRGDDVELYTQTGDLSGFEDGDRVKVRGTVAEVSI
jgi:hypothetical protein